MPVDDIEVTDDLGVVLPSTTTDTEPEMVPLFTVDGVTYEICKEYPASIAVEYLEISSERGENAAWVWLLKTVLGEEAYEVLKTHPLIRKEHMEQIGEIVRRHALGDEKGKGTPRRVSGRPRRAKKRG